MTSAKGPASSTDSGQVAPSVTTQPTNQTVAVGQTATFSVTASGTAPLSFQWRKNGTSIGGAASATYTTAATATSDSGSQFSVAVSNSTGSVISNTATLTVNSASIAITVSPNVATVTIGNTQQFLGTVTGTSNTAVAWSLSGAGCVSAACGTISASGLYAPPGSLPSPGTVSVKATSVADPTKSASASVTIVAALSVLLSISPTSAAVPTSGTQLFTASVTGTSNTAVSWSLGGAGCSGSACGTLSTSASSAVYSAPVVAPSPPTISVVATSGADPSKSASANVTILPAVVVTVAPTSVSVTTASTQEFSASVAGTSNTAVTWAVSGTGCSGAACGTIDSTGLYTGPAVVPDPDTVTVTAASAADPTESASAEVTIRSTSAAYYVDNTCANNGNGTAQNCATSSGGAGPFNSIANAQSAVTGNQSGNSLLLKSGDIFREQYAVPAYGTSGNPFTIGAYGAGPPPIINGANLVTSWTATSTASYYAPEPSTSALGRGSLQVFEDGTRLTQETAGVSSLAPGQWYLNRATSQISVYTIAGDNPSGHTMEVSVRQDCIEDGESMDYVAVQNLTVKNAGWAGVTFNNYWQAIHFISITGVTAEDNYDDGINVYSSPGSGYPINNVTISGNTTTGNGGPGIDVWTDGNTISNVSIIGNIGHDDVWNPSAAPNSPNGEIHVLGPTLNGLTIENNLAYNAGSALPNFKAYPQQYDIGSGIYIDTVPSNVVIAYNEVYNNNDQGIALEDTQGAAIYGNVSYNNGVAGFSNYRLSSGNLWYNNTAYGNNVGFLVWGGTPTTPAGIIDNQFKNNIASNNSVSALQAFNGAENDGTNGYGNIYTYNDFGQQASGFIEWGAGAYYSTYSSWEGATGNCGSTGCSHSVETNPLFVSASSGNFALASSSPTIGAGLNLGSIYEYGLHPGSAWPSNVILDNRTNSGSGWDIGAYVYTQ